MIPPAVTLDKLNIFFTTHHLINFAAIDASSNPVVNIAGSSTTLNSHDTVLRSVFCINKASDPSTAPLFPAIFHFEHVTPQSLRNTLPSLHSNAVGLDGICRRLLQISMSVIFPMVLDLFNMSLQSSTFPDPWKLSHVVPILKSRRPSSSSDYRSISLLCSLSKILEKIVHTQLCAFLNVNDLLDPLQTGFRRGHSTQSAVVKLLDDVRAAIDRRGVAIMIMFDFTKAFDSVDH